MLFFFLDINASLFPPIYVQQSLSPKIIINVKCKRQIEPLKSTFSHPKQLMLWCLPCVMYVHMLTLSLPPSSQRGIGGSPGETRGTCRSHSQQVTKLELGLGLLGSRNGPSFSTHAAFCSIVVVHFRRQRDWPTGCPDTLLSVSERVFLHEINI